LEEDAWPLPEQTIAIGISKEYKYALNIGHLQRTWKRLRFVE